MSRVGGKGGGEGCEVSSRSEEGKKAASRHRSHFLGIGSQEIASGETHLTDLPHLDLLLIGFVAHLDRMISFQRPNDGARESGLRAAPRRRS